jgi:soluble lytic murein transglycosylase-like protein
LAAVTSVSLFQGSDTGMRTSVHTWINFSIPWVAMLFLLCCLCPAHAGGIYKYVDRDGTIHFTNVPTNSRYKLISEDPDTYATVETARFDGLIKEIAYRYDVKPALVKAVIKAESGFDPNAVSKKGAQGLMQLMPETSNGLEVEDPFHPRDNINGGVKFLKQLMGRFNNDLTLTLAAYNAGPEAVAKYEDIPPYEETQHYVKKVLTYYDRYLREI